MLRSVWCFGLFCLLLLSQPVAAGLSVLGEQVALTRDVDFRQVDEATQSIEALLKADESAWQRNDKDIINFGYTKTAYWLRIPLENPATVRIDRLLVLNYPLLDYVDVYLVHNGRVAMEYHVGDHYPFEQRGVKNRLFVLPLHFDASSHYQLYVHARSSSSMQLPMALWETHAFYAENTVKMLGFGFFFGALLIIAAYNFFLWFSVRDASYLYYVAFVLCFSGLVATLEGVGFQFLWSRSIWWNDHSVVFLGCATLSFATLFARDFLQLKVLNSTLNRMSLIYLGVLGVIVVLATMIPYGISILMLLVMSLIWSVMSMVFGVLNYRAGNTSARYFIFAWAFLIVCNVIYMAGQLAVIPRTFLVGIALQLGEIVEVLVLSFALADRINILRREKSQALSHAADAEKRSAEVLLEANHKLQKALDLAEEDHRKKDRFIMAISHELRTPLNAISASVGQLNDVASEDEKISLQKFIKFGADRLSTQVENLIMLAETENSVIKPHLRSFYLEQLLRHTVRVADAYLFNKPVSFQIEKAGDDFIAYRGDDYLLVRMLIPLLENACKYTDHGRVILRAHRKQDGIEFTVIDTGPGIPEAFQHVIYDSFTQVSEGYQRSHEGLGIGLTACKRIALILGATITLESRVGEGSCFHVAVPMQADLDASPLSNAELAGNVLIVEDNLVNAKVLNALVKKLGLTTALAENGQIALEMTREQSFDIVLMDLQMPVMDGFTSAAAMRNEGVHCPIVAVTANSDYEARMRCMEVGMNDVIAKPLNKDTLKEKLTIWMLGQRN